MPVLSFDELCQSDEKYVIFLASMRFTPDFYTQCVYGTPLDRELVFYPARRIFIAYHPNQYFDVFDPRPHEVFVDGGAYDGKSAVAFSKWAKKGYDSIYAFEANPKCERAVRNRLNSVQNYHLIMKGTSDKEGFVTFESRGKSGSCISATGDMDIAMTTIDKEVGENRVTFIKLDVEGSEFKTLVGATHVIQKWKPRLAISVYHKMEDFVELPILVMKLVPEYHLAMRHYTSGMEETVLYAWVED